VASFSSYVKVFTATADHNKNNNKNEINSIGKTVKKFKKWIYSEQKDDDEEEEEDPK